MKILFKCQNKVKKRKCELNCARGHEKCEMSLNQNVIFFMRKYFNNLHIDQCLAQLYGFV